VKIQPAATVQLSMKHTLHIAVRGLIALGLLLVWGTGGRALAYPKLTPAQHAAIQQGWILETKENVPGSSVKAGRAVAIFNDAPEAVTWTMLQVEKFKHYLPRVKDSRIVKRKGWSTYAVIETSLPWPVKDAWVYIKMTRKDKPGRAFEITWSMINGTMKSYHGSVLIEPWNKAGTKTIVTYQMLAHPKTSAPDSMISNGIKQIVGIFVYRTRMRLLALRKFKKLPPGLLRRSSPPT